MAGTHGFAETEVGRRQESVMGTDGVDAAAGEVARDVGVTETAWRQSVAVLQHLVVQSAVNDPVAHPEYIPFRQWLQFQSYPIKSNPNQLN